MKIGIIHTAFIGDIIITWRLIECLYREGHELVFFTKAKNASIPRNDKRIKKVILLNKLNGIKKLFCYYPMIKQIREEKLDVLLCPHRSFSTTLTAFFGKAKLTVGFENATAAFLYDVQAPYPQNTHESIRYLNLILPQFCSQKGLEDAHRYQQWPYLPKEKWSNLSPSPYFVVAPGSAWETKKYVPENLAQICNFILKSYPNLTCCITGARSDEKACQILEKGLCEHSNRVFNFLDLNLPQYIDLVAHSVFLMSNDSSPVHISSAFNIPIICFWGPTPFLRGFWPSADNALIISHQTIFGKNLPCQPCSTHGSKKCPLTHHLCMKKLTPQLVVPRIMDFLRAQIKI